MTVISVHRTYSSDDGGWYVEVSDDQGRTLHVTPTKPRSEHADAKALKWIKDHYPNAEIVRI